MATVAKVYCPDTERQIIADIENILSLSLTLPEDARIENYPELTKEGKPGVELSSEHFTDMDAQLFSSDIPDVYFWLDDPMPPMKFLNGELT